ncbi:hypothetical protein AVEN_173237-1 [Araneus ventricosus]|uniref:Uncharacterized protein n=1 Tax=Araneus ventricosus TaxID=182803 RepID=A0A4Y2H1D4_ARAVE|nr:hypothetical protein AVEN_173237-1 [Araneus ventricosus]
MGKKYLKTCKFPLKRCDYPSYMPKMISSLNVKMLLLANLNMIAQLSDCFPITNVESFCGKIVSTCLRDSFPCRSTVERVVLRNDATAAHQFSPQWELDNVSFADDNFTSEMSCSWACTQFGSFILYLSNMFGSSECFLSLLIGVM